MNIKINTNISSEYKETTITINAPKLSDEIRDFIKYISDMDSISNQIVASNNNEIYFINLEKIICFLAKTNITMQELWTEHIKLNINYMNWKNSLSKRTL